MIVAVVVASELLSTAAQMSQTATCSEQGVVLLQVTQSSKLQVSGSQVPPPAVPPALVGQPPAVPAAANAAPALIGQPPPVSLMVTSGALSGLAAAPASAFPQKFDLSTMDEKKLAPTGQHINHETMAADWGQEYPTAPPLLQVTESGASPRAWQGAAALFLLACWVAHD